MPNITEITSATNPFIKELIQLKKQKGGLFEEGLLLLEGARLCKDALQNEVACTALIVTADFFEKQRELCDLFLQKEVPCYVIADFLGEKISDTKSPQGIFALCKKPQMQSAAAFLQTKGPILILDGIKDPGNLGTIVRTALSFGLAQIALFHQCANPFSPKVTRSSMGMNLLVDFCQGEQAQAFLTQAKSASYEVYASALSADSVDIRQVDKKAPFCLVIGSEAHGISEAFTKGSDTLISIPMKEQVESLNAAMAGAIFIWEFMK